MVLCKTFKGKPKSYFNSIMFKWRSHWNVDWYQGFFIAFEKYATYTDTHNSKQTGASGGVMVSKLE